MQKTSPDEFIAVQQFYRRLGQRAEMAMHGSGSAPQVPPHRELRLVDGWIVWNRRPIWRVGSRGAADVAPVNAVTDKRRAMSARLSALETRLEALEDLLRCDAGDDACQVARRLLGEEAYYASLGGQARRAARGEAPVPQVPPRSELRFADGWLVWNGRPVWWAGSGPDGSSSSARTTGGVEARPAPRSPERSRLRRLLTLPWRRAPA